MEGKKGRKEAEEGRGEGVKEALKAWKAQRKGAEGRLRKGSVVTERAYLSIPFSKLPNK